MSASNLRSARIGAPFSLDTPNRSLAPKSVDEWNSLSYHEFRDRLLPDYYVGIRDYLMTYYTQINRDYVFKSRRHLKPSTPAKPQLSVENEIASSTPTDLLDDASNASSDDVGYDFVGYLICFDNSETIDDEDFERCFSLIESTSAATYKASSTGWSATKKRKEMKLLDMKYLLLKSLSQQCHSVRTTGSRIGSTKGFLSFMVTIEDEHEVLYVYELHLCEELRGKGAGKWMMRQVEKIGRRAGLEKTILTVFRSNEAAIRFYRTLGYEKDKCSPEPRKLRGGKVKEADYLILSKNLGDEVDESSESRPSREAVDEDKEEWDDEEIGNNEKVKKELGDADRKIKVKHQPGDGMNDHDYNVKTLEDEDDYQLKSEKTEQDDYMDTSDYDVRTMEDEDDYKNKMEEA